MTNRSDLIEVIMPDQQPLIGKLEETVLVEGADPRKFYYLDGLFLQGEVENQNGRVYPREEISSAVEKLNQEITKRGPIPGELDHPDGMNINFDRIALGIVEMRMKGNDGYGRMRVIPEGLGKIVEGAIQSGIQVGVSSRGTGNVGSDGRVSDFDIVTIDAVLNPSAPDAFPRASFAESISQYGESIEALKLAEYAKHDPRAREHLARAMKNLFVAMRDDVIWRK